MGAGHRAIVLRMELILTPQNTVHCGRFAGPDQVCVDCGVPFMRGDRRHSDNAKTWPTIQAIETAEVPNGYAGLL